MPKMLGIDILHHIFSRAIYMTVSQIKPTNKDILIARIEGRARVEVEVSDIREGAAWYQQSHSTHCLRLYFDSQALQTFA